MNIILASIIKLYIFIRVVKNKPTKIKQTCLHLLLLHHQLVLNPVSLALLVKVCSYDFLCTFTINNNMYHNNIYIINIIIMYYK